MKKLIVMSENNERYKVDNFHAKSLERNPLNSPSDRDINIYLPPDYFESENKKYPVIYLLHGYGGNNRSWNMTSRTSKDKSIPWELVPRKILKQIDVDRLLTFELLDDLISNGDLAPFVLVQPDGSLQVPNKSGRKDLKGLIAPRGSFYVNSPHSGNYMDYIVQDVIKYIDSNYRTISDREHRALMGGSMGGYGTLYLTLNHPEKFIAAAALSPGNLGNLELLNWKLRVPIYEKIFGSKMSEQMGDLSMDDILDTCDLILSNSNRLLPSIEKDESGNITHLNEQASRNWKKYDLNNVVREHPDAFKKVHLLLNCEKNDEFGIANGTRKIHETLIELGIDHDFELYSDPKAALTPHVLGVGYHELPAIRFCLQYIS